MPIIVGIDCTGGGPIPAESNSGFYVASDKDASVSFVKRLSATGKLNQKYFRGPPLRGGGLMDAIVGGYEFIVYRRRFQPEEPILLTGYSRGAAGAIEIAKKLDFIGVPVRALLMFDCVDRHAFRDASAVPPNVRHVLHLLRSPAAASRESFPNTGLDYNAAQTRYSIYEFLCTHGGLGGTPWLPREGQSVTDLIVESGEEEGAGLATGDTHSGATTITYAQDAQVAGEIWKFLQPFLRAHQFIV